MSDELERRLRDAFDARTRSAVHDSAQPPAPRFAEEQAARTGRRWTHWAAPLAAAAAVVGIGVGVTVVAESPSHHSPVAGNGTLPAATNDVHVKLLNDDGARYGVGMPVIAYFSQRITDARPLQQATVATVNGKQVQGAWYFEKSAAGNGPIEGHFRMAKPWPADSTIEIRMPIDGLSAGGRLHYDDSLTTSFRTGPATSAVVSEATHLLTVTRDGKPIGSYPVVVGPSTRPGFKLIMEKPGTVHMRGPGFDEDVTYAQRLTYGGEYLISAPWENATTIKAGVDTSNGSTYLLPAAAKKLFQLLEIGDIVQYKGTRGVQMAMGSGYGDWNVPWSTWLTGGLVRTR